MSAYRHRARGMTLLEVLIVIAVLAIIAAVSVPSLTSTDPYPLDLAAERLAGALRFARSEALRTGEMHGVLVDPLDQEPLGDEITVYKVDPNGSPFGVEAILYHPMDKQPYAVKLSGSPVAPGVAFTSPDKPFSFRGLAQPQRHVHFDANGAPIYLQDGVFYPLENNDLRLGDAHDERSVLLQPITGRLIVQ